MESPTRLGVLRPIGPTTRQVCTPNLSELAVSSPGWTTLPSRPLHQCRSGAQPRHRPHPAPHETASLHTRPVRTCLLVTGPDHRPQQLPASVQVTAIHPSPPQSAPRRNGKFAHQTCQNLPSGHRPGPLSPADPCISAGHSDSPVAAAERTPTKRQVPTPVPGTPHETASSDTRALSRADRSGRAVGAGAPVPTSSTGPGGSWWRAPAAGVSGSHRWRP